MTTNNQLEFESFNSDFKYDKKQMIRNKLSILLDI